MNPRISVEERRRRLCATINAIDNRDTYETALQSHHDGTCGWAIQLEQLQAWASSQPDKGKLFWVHGPPGFGKTFMSAWIIKYLIEEKQGLVAYFFCVADNQPTRDPYSILRSWLSQLLMKDDRVPALMDAYFATRTSRDQVLTHQDLWQLFRTIGENIAGCTLVIDGFDECNHVNSGAQYHTEDPRSQFLRDLITHLAKTKSRVLVVSRDVRDIRACLSKGSGELPKESQGLEMYEYQITSRDTSSDVELFSENMVKGKLPRKAEDLRVKIAKQAAKRSEGMFLWIKLLENEISPEQNAKELSQTVLEMPSGISEAYTREVEKIEQLSPKHKVQALQILRWVLFAVRPLRVKELAEALIVSHDEESHEYPHDSLPDAWRDGFVDEDYVNGLILGRCGSLLELRSSHLSEPLANQTIHFVHFSVQEYLLSLAPTAPLAKALGLVDTKAEEIRLSKICLRYLTLDVFKEAPPNTDIYPFLSYAAWAWYFHGYLKSPLPSRDIVQWTQKVFDPSQPNWRVWAPVLEAELLDPDDQGSESEPTESITENEGTESEETDSEIKNGESIKGSADEGLERLDLDVMPHTPTEEPCSVSVQNPIYYACLLGLIDVLKWLEEQGLDCCCNGGRFGFPLQAAVARNQFETVAHLLNRQVDVSQKGGRYGSAIVAAGAMSTPYITMLLLDKNADVTSTDTRGWTALHYASGRGSANIVEKLQARGAPIDAVTDFGSTAISLACMNGNTDVVSFLLSKGADLNLADKDGEMPLHIAIAYGQTDLACQLLDAGAPIDAKVSKGWTPLHQAVEIKSPQVVKKLLQLGADVNCRFDDNSTALHEAAYVGDTRIVECLLNAGAQVTYWDDEGLTALHTAAIEGHLNVMKLLLDHGADVEQVAEDYLPVSFVAAQVGNLAVLELLLERGVLVNCIFGCSQETLFDVAMFNKSDNVAEFLVKHGCFQSRSATRTTEKMEWRNTLANRPENNLVMLAYHNDFDAVKSFVQDRHDTATRQNELDEALRVAAACGFVNIVTLLLENGANLGRRDVNGRTALHHAVLNWHEDVAFVLVEEGASLSVEDDIGSTPIDGAVGKGMQALSFVQSYMREWTLSITKRPSHIEYEERRGISGNPLHIRKAVSGAWEGHCEYLTWARDRKDRFSIVVPAPSDHGPVVDDCTFSNEGADMVGKFLYHGFIDEKNVVWFVKLYEEFGWLCRGELDSQLLTLRGTWGSNRKLWFGSFEMTRSLNGFEVE